MVGLIQIPLRPIRAPPCLVREVNRRLEWNRSISTITRTGRLTLGQDWTRVLTYTHTLDRQTEGGRPNDLGGAKG